MDSSPAKPHAPSPLTEILAGHRAEAQDQLRSFWQAFEYTCEERLAELSTRVEEAFQRSLEERVAAELEPAVSKARRELSERLHRAMRRLRQSETREQWADALLDAAALFCRRAALFAVDGQTLNGVRARGLDEETADRFARLAVPLTSAPAFRNVIESRDPVVALREPGELSDAVTGIFGAGECAAYLFPISGAERVVAVLYAEGDETSAPDANALELIAGMAEWDRRARSLPAPSAGLVTIAAPEPAALEAPAARVPAVIPSPAAPVTKPRETPDWSRLSREEQEIHLRAQRFARVQVAEMRLYKPAAVKAGRARRDLYSALKQEIDSSREAFGRLFLAASPTMADYFHMELVRTLANDNAALLGQDYPGPLV